MSEENVVKSKYGRFDGMNAERERSRVKTLRNAFTELQRALPAVPEDTKLSKLDVLILASSYIAHLTNALKREDTSKESVEPCKNTSNGTLRVIKPRRRSHMFQPAVNTRYLHPVKVELFSL